MTQLASLSPMDDLSSRNDKEALLARDVLEHAVLLSIRLKDEDNFERNFLQLETYYFDKLASKNRIQDIWEWVQDTPPSFRQAAVDSWIEIGAAVGTKTYS